MWWRTILMGAAVISSLGVHGPALGQALSPPRGTTPNGAIFDGLRSSTTRPVPQVPPPTVRAPDMTWVPDRFVQVPGVSAPVLMPGHWERRLDNGNVHTPPLTGRSLNGDVVQFPAGANPPVNERQAP
jgi:hypothetical protein